MHADPGGRARTTEVLASTGIEYEPTDGLIYAVTYDGPCDLHTIDPATAVSTFVGTSGVDDCTGVDRQPSRRPPHHRSRDRRGHVGRAHGAVKW